MTNVYGHMIGDCIRWLWFLQTDEYRRFKKEGVKLLCISLDPLKNWQKEIFSLAGVEEEVIRVTEPVIVKRLIVPTPSLTTTEEQNYYRKEYVDTINLMITNALSRGSGKRYATKLFLSRSGWKNEKSDLSISQMLHKQGYQIVYPHKMSVTEQICMLQQVEVLASTEGNISHNALFLRDGTKMEIFRKTLHVNKYSLFINELKHLDAIYIDCSLSIWTNRENWWCGPFFLYINKAVADYYGIEKPRFPIRKFKKYVWNKALRKNDIAFILQNIDGQYADILQSELVDIRQRNKKIVDSLCRIFPILKRKYKGIYNTLNRLSIR